MSNRILTISAAMSEAIAQEMRADPSVFVMGEDIGAYGGIFGATTGLLDEFGAERIRDTPISETAFIGASVGAAMSGMRPIAELMFVDFFGVCMDAIYNLAAKNTYFSGGACPVPMVLMMAGGGGYSDGAQHSQTLYATFAHMPGLKVVTPSNAHDAKGMMIAAIRDDNPVVFMFHKGLQGLGWMASVEGAATKVPEEAYTLPFGEVAVRRTGADVSIVALGLMVHRAIEAAEILQKEGIDAEIIDLRTLVPLDRDGVFRSVKKTGRMVVVDEDYTSYGVTAEVIASVVERDISVLKAAPKRVAYPDIPIPYARPMEQMALPNAVNIAEAARAAFTSKG
ncbi:alpha-ketoacid dehydrogenase subunit beta [Varunaivibrio sulfuroxidans]|uniref:Pyruvate dehydrogenase E1 component beta subunit n=1 Tax=Varunaivibrio sulfuroxidans TaxID=1773489 RepID=A0A4R3J496_9PROT|nr:alpha-ketoacid dehydrogenase subunit beta [Varunaivibrio sulfuroxidans]TCS60679.1 pyruvate dehydrogenase E1 component beta subunit [Varunaivibrio sulfuroxidans]WES30168.1 alpha-ketoacid dehydrogenase subunit beta [Varunaivibrio sulfuroxidans]